MLQVFSVTKSPSHRGVYKSKPENLSRLGTGGIHLRQWRHHRGMTVAVLAEKAGVSAGTVSGIENGLTGWHNQTLEKLANALKITTGMLLDFNPLKGSLTDQAIDIVRGHH